MIRLFLVVSIGLTFSTANITDTAEEVATIFPGRIIYTKWCGPGNDASTYDDLGENTNVDICCRSHDLCDLSVESGKTKFNYKNDDLFTISSCRCDYALRRCLESTHFWVADLVLKVYKFTNKKCLLNVCELEYFRCGRDEIVSVAVFPNLVFTGIDEENDTNKINKIIQDILRNEQKPASESTKTERSNNPANYPWQHPPSDQWQHPPYPWQHRVSYPWTHGHELKQINLAAPNSRRLQYKFVLPHQNSDIFCCADELQNL